MEGHVYVVEFESGLVKVGHTGNPKNRLKSYAKDGSTYGNAVARTWVSPPHFKSMRNETRLIKFCEERGVLAGGREYFTGVPFDEVQAYAASLKFERFDQQRWDRDHAAPNEALRSAVIALLQRHRRIDLPPRMTVSYGTLDEWFAGISDDSRSEDIKCSIADLLDVDLADLVATPLVVQQAIVQHAVDLANLRQDVDRLRELHEAAEMALTEHVTTKLDELRGKIKDSVNEAWLGRTEERRVTLPDGTPARIRVARGLPQEEAERLAADYWQPGAAAP
jgi:hypothetical protein